MSSDLIAAGLPALAVSGLCALFAWSRTAWYAPATLWSGFCFAGIAALWWVIESGLHLPAAMLSPMPTLHLEAQFPRTALFFTLQATIGPLAVFGHRPDRAARAEGMAAMRESLARVRSHPAALAYAAFAFALAGVHFAMIDKSALYLNTEYLSLSDPTRNGTGLGAGALVNNALRPLLLPAFLLLAVPSGRRGPDLATLLLAAACAYGLAFSLAVYSRYLMVYVFVFFLGRIFAGGGAGGLRGALGLVVAAAAVFFCFAIALTGRGHQTQGLGSAPEVLATLDLAHAGWLLTRLAVTSFDGAMSFANALRYAPSYEAEYQILSFSPFPSLIDGFSGIEREMARRINIYVPMSAFGEVAHFHWTAAPALFALCALSVRRLTLGFFRDRDAATAALYPVFLVCMLHLQTYPLRMSLRVLLAAALLSWITSRLRRRRLMREEAEPLAA